MYDRGPSDGELAAIGILREDVEDHSVLDVWPENWEAYTVFEALRTQWRTGTGGVVGLDYNVAFKVMDVMGVKSKHRRRTIEAIRVMEREALNQLYKK